MDAQAHHSRCLNATHSGLLTTHVIVGAGYYSHVGDLDMLLSACKRYDQAFPIPHSYTEEEE